MSDSLITSVTTILLAIVGLAVIATIVSKNANTSAVIGAGGNAFTQSLGAATSPVTGGSFSSNLSGLSASLG